MKSQQGFTLIELVVVIVLLGILAAAAIPRFVDLSDEAEQASLNATVQAVQSATILNFAKFKASRGDKGTSLSGANGDVCKDTVLGQFMVGGWPSAYTVAPSAATAGTDETAFCLITSTTNSSVKQDEVPVILTSAPVTP